MLLRVPLGRTRTLHLTAACVIRHCRSTFCRACMAETPQVTVVSRPEEENLIISLVQAGRERHLDRPRTEPLQRALARLQKNAVITGKRPKKGKASATSAQGAAAEQIDAELRRSPDGLAIPGLTPNEDAWSVASELQVGTLKYSVRFNPATVDKIEIPGKALIGYPLYPLIQLVFAKEPDCQWQWLRRKAGTTTHRQSATEGNGSSVDHWHSINGATSRLYTPTADDEGFQLRVDCTPFQARPHSCSAGCNETHMDSGVTASCITQSVQPGPALGAGSKRHPLTSCPLAPPGFRVLTYNILADQYAATEHAQKVLFSYCPQQFRDPWYRRALVLRELLGYNADVMCLQEVDEKAFDLYLLPHLRQQGFDGLYVNKAFSAREGSATFFRAARYRLHTYFSFALKDIVNDIMHCAAVKHRHTQLHDILQRNSSLLHDLSKVSTTCQMSILLPQLEAEQDAALCVVNTHLFFHPLAAHLRTVMTAAIIVEALHAVDSHVSTQLEQQDAVMRPALLFCGDLNSDLNDGMPGNLELLQQGQLPASHWDWQSGAAFRFWEGEGAGAAADEGPEAEARGQPAAAQPPAHAPAAGSTGSEWQEHASPDGSRPSFWARPLELPHRLASADGLSNQATNYVRGYAGALDYVWYDPGELEVVRPIPLPGVEELQGWIPSERFPSDHLAPTRRAPSKRFIGSPPRPPADSQAAAQVVFDMRPLPASVEAPAPVRARDSTTSTTAAAADARAVAGPSAAQRWRAHEGDLGVAPTRHPASAQNGRKLLPAEMSSVSSVVECLQRDEVVALPTDTIYGLGARASSTCAIERIYHIKGRPSRLPLAICVADASAVQQYGDCQHVSPALLQSLLPGPVTLVLRRREDARLAAQLNPGVATIGIRVPDSSFIQAVCRSFGEAVALTSANVSGGVSSTCTADFQALWSMCAVVVDAGRVSDSRSGSTIVALSKPGSFRILRSGSHEAATRAVLVEHGLTETEEAPC